MLSTWLVIAGAVMYVFAWFAPVITHINPPTEHLAENRTTFGGWEAFRYALLQPFEHFSSSWPGNLLYLSSALSNFVLAGTFVDVALTAGHTHLTLRAAVLVSAVLNTHWLRVRDDETTLRLGYYLWAGAFFLIAAGLAMGDGIATLWPSTELFLRPALLVVAGSVVLVGIFTIWIDRRNVKAPEMEEQDETESKPWDRRVAVLGSALLCLIAAVVVVSQVTPQMDEMQTIRPWELRLALPLFAVLLGAILVALSLSIRRSVWGVLGLILVVSMGALPSVLVVLSPQFNLPTPFFLFALAFWLMVACAAVAADSKKGLVSVMLALFAASTVATVFCEIGLHVPMQFATEPMKALHGLTGVIDFRLALGVLFGVVCVGTATVRAFAISLQNPPRIPTPQLPRLSASHPFLAPLTNPLIIVVNGGLFAGVAIANVLVGVLVTLFLRLVHIGFEVARLLWEVLVENNAALKLLKVLVAMVVTFTVIVSAFQLSPHVREYLRASREGVYQQLPFVGALALAVLLGGTIIALVVDGRKVMPARALFGASLIVVLLVLAGGGVYVLAAMHAVEIAGFDRIGPISIVAASLMLVGIGTVTFINVAERKRDNTPGGAI